MNIIAGSGVSRYLQHRPPVSSSLFPDVDIPGEYPPGVCACVCVCV